MRVDGFNASQIKSGQRGVEVKIERGKVDKALSLSVWYLLKPARHSEAGLGSQD